MATTTSAIFLQDYMVAVTPSTEAGASSMTAVTTDDNGGNEQRTQPGGVGTTAYSPSDYADTRYRPTVEDNTAEATGAAQDDAAEANGDMTVDFGFRTNDGVGIYGVLRC
ncbi:MAG: hypothetical protein R2795_04825 [Saprospiraceae bacterium]